MKTRLLLCVAIVAGCDSPMIPGHDVVDVYEFRLPTTPPRSLRWSTGKTIRVFVEQGTSTDRTTLLENAFADGAAAWNDVATFGEYRLASTARIENADAVLAWSDVLPPVDVTECLPAVSRAVTTFCINAIDTETPSVHTFPLRPPADPAASRVKVLVTILAAEATDPARIRGLVAHELGHVLGISRHSDDARDLMFQTELTTAEPSRRDIATVQILYHTTIDIVF